MLNMISNARRWCTGRASRGGCLLLAALSMAAAGCPSGGNELPSVDFVSVSIENSAFMPKELTIEVGQTVRWTNNDPVFHTVTSGAPGDTDAGALFDSNDLLSFDSFSHQFNTAGEFTYFSKLDQGRPGMVGAKIIVVEPAPSGA